MKNVFYLLVLVLVLACQKPEKVAPLRNATVLAWNCGTAPGWMLEMDGDTVITLCDDFRSEFGFEIKEPVHVLVRYEDLISAGDYRYIKVTSYEIKYYAN